MPSCQPDVPADHPVHGFRVRGRLGHHVCASRGGVVLLFLLGCRQGAQSGGGTGSFCILRWHGGIGYEIGFLSLSLLFLFGGRLVSPCLMWIYAVQRLPGMFPIGRHAARLVRSFKVVALRTVLGIGRAMNLKVVMVAGGV